MALRFYLDPLIIVNKTDRAGNVIGNYRTCKYLELITGAPAQFLEYGKQMVCLLLADVTPQQHSDLSVQPDVSAFPQNSNIDNTVGAANVATVQAELESQNIPSNWVRGTMSWRVVLRVVAGIMQIAQRVDELDPSDGRLLPDGVTMSTPYSAMPVAFRNHLVQAIDEIGYDRSGLTASSTLRDLLEAVANQPTPFELLGIKI